MDDVSVDLNPEGNRTAAISTASPYVYIPEMEFYTLHGMLHSKIPSLYLNGTIMSDKPCTKSLGLPNITFSLGHASYPYEFEIPY